MPSSVIFGLEGTVLKDDEVRFFKDTDPLGFILFARNIEHPDQVRALTDTLRHAVGRENIPILIDQEGGRVQRMRPPHWRKMPAASVFGALWHKDPEIAQRALWLHSTLTALELLLCGVNVNCAPLLDLPIDGAHDIIGDRAFSSDISIVTELARSQMDAFMHHGVLPVIKHMPGHGRALCDSHKDLPRVDSALEELQRTDFQTFMALNTAPLGMTAHIVFSDIDASAPVTQSATAINEIIRGHIGFQGLLMTDDLSMEALKGDLETRTKDCLSAGCDIVLHCNGEMTEMENVANGLSPMSDIALARWEKAAVTLESNGQKYSSAQMLDMKEELETYLSRLS